MEQSRQAQMNNYKAFGRRPGNRNLTVEKAKDKKGTLKRLIAYFAAEKAMIIGLLAAVIIIHLCLSALLHSIHFLSAVTHKYLYISHLSL